MPRKSRIDTLGALHHLIARGIGKRKIFDDDLDRNLFLERLGAILVETQTLCYAWALCNLRSIYRADPGINRFIDSDDDRGHVCKREACYGSEFIVP